MVPLYWHEGWPSFSSIVVHSREWFWPVAGSEGSAWNNLYGRGGAVAENRKGDECREVDLERKSAGRPCTESRSMWNAPEFPQIQRQDLIGNMSKPESALVRRKFNLIWRIKTNNNKKPARKFSIRLKKDRHKKRKRKRKEQPLNKWTQSSIAEELVFLLLLDRLHWKPTIYHCFLPWQKRNACRLQLLQLLLLIVVGVEWPVCRVTKRWIEVCFQPWYNPLWLTGLKTPAY